MMTRADTVDARETRSVVEMTCVWDINAQRARSKFIWPVLCHLPRPAALEAQP